MTQPDGTVITVEKGPDPRFGMLAPLRLSQTVETAGGRKAVVTFDRESVLEDDNDLFSLVTQTDSLVVNGRESTATYTAESRTLVRVSSERRQSTAALDTQGRVLREEIPGLAAITFSYDAHGRLAAITRGNGPDARTTSATFDAAGFIDGITDPLNQRTEFVRDAVGRVLKETLPGGRTIQYGYDVGGRMMTITPPGQPAHAFAYTAADQGSQYAPPDLGPGYESTKYDYNLDRQPTTKTSQSWLTDLSYDDAGRLNALTFSRGQIGFGYDPVSGNLTSVTGPGGVADTFGYDGALLTREVRSGTLPGTVTRSYDDDLRPVALGVNGSSVANSYDADGFLTDSGDLTMTRSPENGLVTATSLGAVADASSYNVFGELASYDVGPLYSASYVRDRLGRITRRVETIEGRTATYDYGYDSAGRVQHALVDGATVARYGYDQKYCVSIASGANSGPRFS